MPRKYKCYFGCKRTGTLHKFPNLSEEKPESTERAEKWFAVIDPLILESDEKIHIISKLRLCDKHFEKAYVLPSRKLTRNAVPTLCLETEINTQEDIPDCTQLADDLAKTYDPNKLMINELVNYESPQSLFEMDNILLVVSEDTEELPIERLHSRTPSPCFTNSPAAPFSEVEYLSDEESEETCNTINLDDLLLYTNTDEATLSQVEVEEIVPKQKKLTENITPEEKRYKVIIQRQRKKIEVLRNKYRRVKSELQTAHKMLKKKSRQESFIDNLPVELQTFIKLQLKKEYQPKGRRFSKDEKRMAIQMMSESPTAYNLLQKIFVLPSTRALTNARRDEILHAFKDILVSQNEEES